MEIAARKLFFTKTLLGWYGQNNRPLPWKGEKNPYYIWLSEIILQQTRVAQGWSYFEKFRSNYPTIFDLAKAPEDEVMKLWQGLGYYSRARNLHYTAQYIVNHYEGQFPDTYDTILSLKGIGPYTAAAIASFGFNLPYAVVDGNVYRVLSRFFGIRSPIDSTTGKKEFSRLAEELLEKNNPGKYNQAIMDFGAVQCTPANPNCDNCPMKIQCTAFQEGQVTGLPVKSKKIKRKSRYFNFLVCRRSGTLLLHKRTKQDIWKNLYAFPVIESANLIDQDHLVLNEEFQKLINNRSFQIKNISKPFQQLLTHQKIIAVFWEIELNSDLMLNEPAFYEVNQKNINNFALPKIIDWYLKDKSLYLKLF